MSQRWKTRKGDNLLIVLMRPSFLTYCSYLNHILHGLKQLQEFIEAVVAHTALPTEVVVIRRDELGKEDAVAGLAGEKVDDLPAEFAHTNQLLFALLFVVGKKKDCNLRLESLCHVFSSV